ncbi:MAG: putative beta-lysine N-acetyltransferase [Phycisphaerae bacterium]
MPDTIEKLGDSVIQHGKENDRVYLMKLAKADSDKIVPRIEQLAEENDYSKIFAKVPAWGRELFLENGFEAEAAVPKFYSGEEDALFMSRFLKDWRAEEKPRERHEEVKKAAIERTGDGVADLPEGAEWRICKPEDAEDMTEVYQQVFDSYPFPIDDPAYIRKTMETHVVYFGIWSDGKLMALSSAEMDKDARNVEMTDFATLPDFRGHSVGTFLLARMEEQMQRREILTAYTIARSVSFGMNITFARLNYHYSGRLVNNTNISGGFESMNIWYKPLFDPAE